MIIKIANQKTYDMMKKLDSSIRNACSLHLYGFTHGKLAIFILSTIICEFAKGADIQRKSLIHLIEQVWEGAVKAEIVADDPLISTSVEIEK